MVVGTWRSDADWERRERDGTYGFSQIYWSQTMKSLEYIENKFVLTSIFYWKPVYADQYGCDMIHLLCPYYESGSCVVHSLGVYLLKCTG